MNKNILLLFSFLITLILCNCFVLSKDLNNDGIVDIRDLSIVAKAFGSKQGDTNWNPDADLNKDGTINIIDLNMVADNMREISSKSQPSGISSTSLLSISNIISWVKNLFIKPTAVQSSAKTIVYVDPIKIVDSRLTSGKTFTIDVNVYNVSDPSLYGFELDLKYNPNILKVTDVKVSDFLNVNPSINQIFQTYDVKDDYVKIIASSLGYVNGKSGSGTLVNVTFQVIGEEETSLDLFDGMLVGYKRIEDPAPIEIKNVIQDDGYFNNNPGMKIQYSIMRPSYGTIIY